MWAYSALLLSIVAVSASANGRYEAPQRRGYFPPNNYEEDQHLSGDEAGKIDKANAISGSGKSSRDKRELIFFHLPRFFFRGLLFPYFIMESYFLENDFSLSGKLNTEM